MSVELKIVDYADPKQAADFMMLLDHYSQDPMGSGAPLPDEVKNTLVAEIQKRDFFASAIAYVDGKPAALVNFAEGFSTFSAKPLVNVHDLVVHADFRGQGLSHKLLKFVEDEAKERGCCKVTLEVLSENTVAIKSYEKFGFKPYQLTEAGGPAQFWQKKLT
jgi:ribosomal protein S18 acetylase RimI-like enzyme